MAATGSSLWKITRGPLRCLMMFPSRNDCPDLIPGDRALLSPRVEVVSFQACPSLCTFFGLFRSIDSFDS